MTIEDDIRFFERLLGKQRGGKSRAMAAPLPPAVPVALRIAPVDQRLSVCAVTSKVRARGAAARRPPHPRSRYARRQAIAALSRAGPRAGARAAPPPRPGTP